MDDAKALVQVELNVPLAVKLIEGKEEGDGFSLGCFFDDLVVVNRNDLCDRHYH